MTFMWAIAVVFANECHLKENHMSFCSCGLVKLLKKGIPTLIILLVPALPDIPSPSAVMTAVHKPVWVILVIKKYVNNQIHKQTVYFTSSSEKWSWTCILLFYLLYW